LGRHYCGPGANWCLVWRIWPWGIWTGGFNLLNLQHARGSETAKIRDHQLVEGVEDNAAEEISFRSLIATKEERSLTCQEAIEQAPKVEAQKQDKG
jgi:hypothetical protein